MDHGRGQPGCPRRCRRAEEWQRLSADVDSKGERLYDRLLVDPVAYQHLLLVRRSISKPDELAYYRGHECGVRWDRPAPADRPRRCGSTSAPSTIRTGTGTAVTISLPRG